MSLIPHMFDLGRPFNNMDRDFVPPDDLFNFSPFNRLAVRSFYAPSCYKPFENVFKSLENIISPVEQMSAALNRLALNELGKISSDNDKFQVNIDVQHFSPEEIDVKVVDGHIVVQGKHEEKEDDHGFISRQFVRRYALPQGCLPDTVESKLSSDGVLTVTAPKVLAMPSIGERIVPITHTGPVKKQLGTSDFTESK